MSPTHTCSLHHDDLADPFPRFAEKQTPSTLEDVRAYASELMRPEPRRVDDDDDEQGEGGEMRGCREAVEILTRISKKGPFSPWFTENRC